MPRDIVGPIAVISLHASPLGALGRGENGGGNLAVRRLCEGLSGFGIPTDVFVRRDDDVACDEELIAPMSRLVRLPIGPPGPVPKAALAAHATEFSRAVVAHAASERRSYEVVHGHYWLGGLVAQRLRDAWQVPWVQSFHTLARTKARAGLPLDETRAQAEAALVAGADRLVTGSVAEARDLMRLYGAGRNRICVAQPGVDLRVLSPHRTADLRARLGLGSRRVLLFAGRLEPLKGADTLLNAVAQLSAEPRFDDVMTLVIGEDSGDGAAAGGERRRLEALAATHGLTSRVRFLGAVEHDELADYYDLADVFVMPSRTETFGLVALEAQAVGTPVVASAVGGLTEIVEHESTGILVAAQRPDEFAGAMARLLDDPGLRERMGEAARRRAASFTWERASDRLASIYGRVARPAGLAATPCGYVDDEVMAVAG